MYYSKKSLGIILMVLGFLMSAILFLILGRGDISDFFRTDFFWIIGMPIICVGLVIYTIAINKKELKIGLFSKILLFILILIWIGSAFFILKDKFLLIK